VPDETHRRPVYHRIQSAEDNELMERTGKVGGRPMRNITAGRFPKVKAFYGPLPPDQSGIEFTTPIPPDRGSPPAVAYWSADTPGVEVIDQNDYVQIPVTILRRQD
jgi:hypothetical protein